MPSELELKRVDVPKEPGQDGELGAAADGDYDPHLHRQVAHPTNDLETLVHLLKCSLGTGILAMPQAFSRAGLVTGSLATLLVGALCTYCLHVLVRSQYALCARLRVPLLSYPASLAAALEAGPPALRGGARAAARAVDLFLVVYQLGICCVYIVFIAKNIKTICDPYYEASVEAHMAAVLVPLVAFNCIRNLKLLAPWSTAANLVTLLGVAVVLYYVLTGRKASYPAPLDLWGSFYTFPLYFGTVLFALTTVGVVLALENNMKTPKSFGRRCGVLNVGMGFITALYVAVGALGYVYCVDDCSDSITLDLPRDDPLAASVTGLFAAAIFVSYGLQCYVPVEVVWRGYLLPRLQAAGSRRLLLWEYALRVALCLLTFALAVSVPQLGLFISLFGALCLSALGVCFPALMELCVGYAAGVRGVAWGALLAKDTLVLAVGAVGLVAGTYTALLEIARTFSAPPHSLPPTLYALHTPANLSLDLA